MEPVDAAVARPTGRQRPTASGPSLAEVAKRAGVSAQTVSRVSMGLNNVRPTTRDRVLAAMAELGYIPNAAARALRSGSFDTIGVIAHRLGRTGESGTVEAIIEAAREYGYAIMLLDIESPSAVGMTAAVSRLTSLSIDGLIIIRAETAFPENLALPTGLPVAISDARFLGRHPSVGADQVGGTRAAVQHLLSLGHNTVHHVTGPAGSAPAQQRLHTWRAELRSAGRPVPEPYRGDWTADSGYRAGQQIAADPSVTAVFCGNDEMAAGVIHALHAAGRQVPREVSVVGFDNIQLAAYLWPPLTTVDTHFAAIGRELVELVIRQIRGESVSNNDDVTVPTSLVVRGSTAAPQARPGKVSGCGPRKTSIERRAGLGV